MNYGKFKNQNSSAQACETQNKVNHSSDNIDVIIFIYINTQAVDDEWLWTKP